jgi:molecular chaperone HtpG
VRLSGRLTASPACLVGAEHDYSPQLEKLLQKGKGGGPKQRRILELNPNHPAVARMRERFEAATAAREETGSETKGEGSKGKASKGKGSKKKKAADFPLADYAHLLFGYACLAEGSEMPEPARFNRAVAELMQKTL